MLPYSLIRPLLFQMDAETAHYLAIRTLKHAPFLAEHKPAATNPMLAQTIAGLSFQHPVGMAAGFDKNAEIIPGLAAMGFSFVECGTVTPKPQAGNPRPRLFRLPEDSAIINRMGFNNQGLEAFSKNFSAGRNGVKTIIGANIGKNKESPNDFSDYATCMRALWQQADYITINISSPNTPNLREIQKQEYLEQFLRECDDIRRALQAEHSKKTPIFLKIAPDSEPQEVQAITELCVKYQLDALIISNTTLHERDRLKHIRHAQETGGLSGIPVFERSTRALAAAYQVAKGRLPLIGVGGILSAADAYAKITAGASLVQLYTGLIYKGFFLIDEINTGLLQQLQQQGFSHISEAVGTSRP